MEVTIGKEGLDFTWQQEFPETTTCCKCGGEAHIAFVAHEGQHGVTAATKKGGLATDANGQPFICSLHENKGAGSFWLHDCCAVAVYFCKDCLEVTAQYNQG